MNEDRLADAIGASASRDGGRIGDCAVCGLSLPLRLPGPLQRGSAWICKGCGARYEAILDRSAADQWLGNVRPAAIEFDRSDLVQPPQAVAAFIRKMQGEDQDFEDRRGATRHRLITHVAAVPVDDGFHRTGEPFVAITRDISTTGLALVHTRAIENEMLVVELPAPSGQVMQVVMQVIRCRPLGRFYEIAGRFVVRMGS